MLFRTRDLPVRQRTQLINALRGHLAEHGVGAPQGPTNLKILAEAVDAETTSLPLLVMEPSRVFLEQIDGLSRTVINSIRRRPTKPPAAQRRFACKPCQTWGRSRPLQLRLSRRRWQFLRVDATSPHGSDLFPDNTQRAPSRLSGKHRDGGSATSGGC